MITKISDKGINLIKQFEGCRLTAYKCPAGVWTIGYGHTSGVTHGMEITQEQADTFLALDLEKYEAKVFQYSDYDWTQNEFDALVSFAYNLGSIDGLTANGTRTKIQIANKIPLYNKAAGRVLEGLTRRRNAERNLFLSTDCQYPTLKNGSRGLIVFQLQTILSELGYYNGEIDGQFGYYTMVAVLKFQMDTGLVQDGVVGSKTWAKLGEYSTSL